MVNVEAIQPKQGTRSMKEYRDLVINLHYTDICNYRCRFCHSRFGKTPLELEEWKRIIANIVKDVDVRRFNLAGGEPLAAPFAQELIDHIHGLGIPVSIITNGSLLTPSWIDDNRNKLSMIGISVDAFRHEDCSPVVEDTEDIVNAYIVVNPMGRLLDNTGGRYRETPSLLDHSFGEVFPEVAFDRRAYERRY